MISSILLSTLSIFSVPTFQLDAQSTLAVKPVADEAVGTVGSISEDSFELTLDDGTTVTVTIDDDTTYTLDGEPARKGSVLVEGKKVRVTHTDKLASVVAARSE